jgi:two-component system sensor histidine kinase BarA
LAVLDGVVPQKMKIQRLRGSLKGWQRNPDTLQLRVQTAAICMLLLLLLLVAALLSEARARLYASESASVELESSVLALRAKEGMNLADYVTRQAREEWLQTAALRPHASYAAGLSNFRKMIAQVSIIDASGYLLASSLSPVVERLYLGDREHFKVHRNTRTDAVYISRTVVGRVSGVESIQVSRPILAPDGGFVGVVVVSLSIAQFMVGEFLVVEQAGRCAALVGLDGFVRVVLKGECAASLERMRAPLGLGNLALDKEGPKLESASHTTALDDLPLRMVVWQPQLKLRNTLVAWYSLAFGMCLLIALGVAIHVRGILQLIRIRESARQRLEELNIQANSANEMKSKFVAGISHELRTPLNGIMGFSELTEMSDTLEEAKAYSKIVFSSAQNLHRMVDVLLDLAKIEAGQLHVVPTSVKVLELFDSVMALHRMEAEHKGLTLSLSIGNGSPEVFMIDRIKLMQVINNVIGNAVKYTGSGAIFVSVDRVDTMWKVQVIDSGVGIDSTLVQHVFDRFGNFRSHSAQMVENQGPGLRLALCKELMELMGGAIELQSELGFGTAVTLTFGDLNG